MGRLPLVSPLKTEVKNKMKKFKEEIKYNLIKPIKYTQGGSGLIDAKYITVKAPSVKVRKHLGYIEREYFAMAQMASQKTDKKATAKEIQEAREAISKMQENPEEEGKIILMAISSSQNIEMCQEHFLEILYKDAMVDDKEKFTEIMADKMSYSDLKNLMGVYLGNFLDLAL